LRLKGPVMGSVSVEQVGQAWTRFRDVKFSQKSLD